MRAIDVAYPHLAAAARIIDVGDVAGLRPAVLPLSPDLERKLSADAANGEGPAVRVLVPDPGAGAPDLAALGPGLDGARSGDRLLILLGRADWYASHLLDPLTRAGWHVEEFVPITNRPFEAAIVAVLGSKRSPDLARLRNEYAYLEHVERQQLAELEERSDAVRTLEDRLEGARAEVARLRAALERQERARAADGELERLRAALARARAQTDVVTDRWHRAQERASAYEGRATALQARLRAMSEQLQEARAANRRLKRTLGYRVHRAIRRILRWPIRQLRRGARRATGRRGAGRPAASGQAATGTQQAAAALAGAAVPTSAPSVGPRVALPPRRPVQRDLRVAAILDEMSEACFAPECELLRITPNDWATVLDERQPHFLLVESAWKGNGGTWQYKIGRYNHPDAAGLEDLLTYCRERGIPTVFWNKEDPVHFDRFKHAAAQFDVVLTTDADCIERYRALPGLRAHHVGLLTFAAQPRLHNPIHAGERLPAPCFAGSYYGNRHRDRALQQEMLLDAAREFGLVIYDRNHGSGAAEFEFPERFRPHIKGRLPYAQLARVYKQHRAFLNVNSVVDSPTMLSRRVYELLASGTPVVTTPSRAIELIFGRLVHSVSESGEAREALRAVLSDDGWSTPARDGLRFVLRHHTYAHRLRAIAAAAGVETDDDDPDAVSWLVLDSDAARVGATIEALRGAGSGQIREVLIGTPPGVETQAVASALDQSLPSDVRSAVHPLPERSGPAAYAGLARLATHPWVLVGGLDEDDPDASLVGDLLDAIRYAGADVFGRALPGGAGPTDQVYLDAVDTRTAVVRTELVRQRGWDRSPDGVAGLDGLRREGARMFSVGAAPVPAPVVVGRP